MPDMYDPASDESGFSITGADIAAIIGSVTPIIAGASGLQPVYNPATRSYVYMQPGATMGGAFPGTVATVGGLSMGTLLLIGGAAYLLMRRKG